MDITAVSYICQIGFSRINLYQPSAEGLAEQHKGAQFPIRFILDEEAGGIAQDQPEENNHEIDVIQESYLDKRIDHIRAEERVHTRQYALMQAVIPKHVHRDMLEEPQSEDTEQHESDHARTHQYRDIAVVEIRHDGSQRSVLIRELDPVLKDTGTVFIDIALADTEDRILQEHLRRLLPEHKASRIEVGVLMLKGHGGLVMSDLIRHGIVGDRR